MKKIITIILLAFIISSCEKKACYDFEIFNFYNITPERAGYPYHTKVELTKCDITEEDAQLVRYTNNFSDTVNVVIDSVNYSIIMKQVCEYH